MPHSGVLMNALACRPTRRCSMSPAIARSALEDDAEPRLAHLAARPVRCWIRASSQLRHSCITAAMRRARAQSGTRRAIPVERLNHGAVRSPPLSTSRHGYLQHPLHPPEVHYLGSHVLQVCLGNDTNLSAGPLPFVREPQECANLPDREPKDSGTPDEVQALEVAGSIQSVAARATSRSRQQTDPLVIADRLDVGPRVFRQRPDGDVASRIHPLPLPRKIPLEPVVTPDFTLITTEKGGAH